MAWERTYNKPTVYDEPYLVTITRPAGWKPSKTANSAGQYPADVLGVIPGETYELPYVADGKITTGHSDVWKLGPLYKASAERSAVLKVRNTSGTPDPHASDPDKPKLRDGAGGGVEEGVFEVVIDKRRFLGKFRLVRGPIMKMKGGGFTDPSPIEKKKKEKKVARKKPVAKKRRK